MSFGFQLSAGVEFTFPNVVLEPGQRAFVVENAGAFAAKYGSDKLVLGEYSGKLDNAGERLVLTGPLREPILDFTYDDAWYPITDGLGFSLVITENEAPTSTWSDPASWHPNADPTISRVVINEIARHPINGAVEEIELRNLAAEPADISGWYITDNVHNLNYRISTGTVIPAGGYLTLTDSNFGPDLARDNEELFLLSGNADGTLSGYLNSVRVSGQTADVSSGRYINSVGDEQFVRQFESTFGGPNAGPFVPAVVISEIMYRPSDVLANGAYWNNTEDEYVELYNRVTRPVTLEGVHLEGAGIDYRFESVLIGPGAYLLVVNFDPASDTQQLARFRGKYSVPASVQIAGPYTGSLANRAGGLAVSVPAIYPQFEAELERVDYSRNAPWTSLPDGAGLSLQRVLLNEYANDPANWRAVTTSPGRASASGAGPVITAQPQSRTVVASPSATASFSVTVAGPNSRYQWRKNTEPIAGATNGTLTVAATNSLDAGDFDVIVSNDTGFTVSSNAALTVLIGISIVQQPQNSSLHAPGTARFTILASSPSPITYQWRFNGNPIPQSNGPELVLTNIGEDNEGLYDVMMTDAVGPVISTAARLTVLAPPVMAAPVPPVNLAGVAGELLTVSARLGGTLPIAARWRWTRADGSTLTIADQTINERTVPFSFVVPVDTVGRVRLSLTNMVGGSFATAVTNAIVTVLADSDGDHIPDAYELAHGMNANNPADAAGDPDGDGMSNRDEYIAGTDPQDANSYLKVELLSATLASIHFQAVSNRSYTVQYTDALNAPAWQHLEHVVARQSNYSAIVIDPASVPKRFYRLATPATP